MRKLTLILTIIIAVVLLLGALLISRWTREIEPAQAESAIFRAAQSDQAGVDINSAFTFSFAEPVSSAAVNKSLTVSPEIAIGVHQGVSNQEVLVAPAEPLSPGTLYSFTLNAEGKRYTWAVQTRQDLLAISHSPAQQSLGVSVDAPIDIVFNQMLDIDLSQAAEYFTITPQVEGTFSQQGRVLRFIPAAPLQAGAVYKVQLQQGLPLLSSSLVLSNSLSFAFETADEGALSGWRAESAASFLSSEIPGFTLFVDTPLDPAGQWMAQAQLYAYESADAYAEVLAEIMESKPLWSKSFSCLQGCSTAGAMQLGAPLSLPLPGESRSYQLYWDESLAPGHYLLRLYFLGGSRDLLFAVSDLNAYQLHDSSQTLLWVYDARLRQPVAAVVRDWQSGALSMAAADGLATIANNDGPAIYRLEYEQQTLVLPLWENSAVATDQRSAWRYLYTDKNAYSNGETLYYYGFLQPRGGWTLEYEHISVYITEQGGDADNYIFKDIIPLQAGAFSASVRLPELRSGAYQLHIYQSGVRYLSADFSVDLPEQTDTAVNTVAAAPGAAARLTADRQSYDLGQSFQVSGQRQNAAAWLFVEAEGGVKAATAGESNLYSGVFQPQQLLDSYVFGVATDGARFFPAPELRLSRDYSGQQLHIKLLNTPVLKAGQTATLELELSDSQGLPVPATGVALQVIYSEEQPQADAAAAIFGDHGGSGLSGAAATIEPTPRRSGSTVFWTLLNSDEQGRVRTEITLPAGQSNCYLIAQSVALIAEQACAGSLVKRLPCAYTPPSDEPETEQPPPDFAYRSGALGLEQSIDISNGNLLILAAPERMQILSLLAEAACGAVDEAESALAAAHARQLLMDYGGDDLRAVFGAAALDCGAWQKPNGGVGDMDAVSDAEVSALAAAMAPAGLAWHELNDYFVSLLSSGSAALPRQALALAGLAAAGKPVLNEVNVLLARPELDEASYWWLLWALYCCGDRQTVLSHYHSGLRPLPGDADPDGAHALVAAACGDSAAALELLGRHPGQLIAQRVLTARLLLTRTSQQQTEFSYSLDGEQRQGQVSGVSDLLLPLSRANESLTLEQSSGPLSYLKFTVQP